MIHIYIFIFLLLLILIISFIFIFDKREKKEKNELSESFISETKSDSENNILKNGSFQNGKNIEQFFDKSGNADIIVFPNPSNSEYVLRQSKNSKMDPRKEIFYKIKLNIKENKIYYLKCLYFSTNNLPLIHKIEYKNYNKSIFLKTLHNNDNSTFNTNYCLFQTPSDENELVEISISLMYNINNISGYNYITDVVLEEIFDGYNIPIIGNLRCYLNTFHPKSVQPSNNLIKDISGNNNNFTASRGVGVQKMVVDLTSNILTGPNSFLLQNKDRLKYYDKFTLFLFIKAFTPPVSKPLLNNNRIIEEEDTQVILKPIGTTILKISGNQYTALELIIPEKYGHIYLIAGGETYKTQVQFLVSLESMIAITYNGERIFLYLNEVLVLDVLCPKIYFNNPPIMINPNGSFKGNFYAFAYYNDVMKKDDIIKMSKYFIRIVATGDELEIPISDINIDDFILRYTYDNQVCESSGYVKQEMEDENVKGVEASEIGAKVESESGIESTGRMRQKINNKIDDNCPEVIFENDHYYVIVPYDSKLSKNIGYGGIRDYGTNIDNAKKIFEINFPKCKLPDILDKNKYKANLENCPFIMLQPENPCNQFECKNTDWTKGIPDNSQCKRSVDVYCSKYSDIDSACYCWKEENKNLPDCLKWRGNFEAEDKCDFRKFDIEQHPDSKDYIKKSKIPCWGCNLDAPESAGEYANREGSGAR